MLMYAINLISKGVKWACPINVNHDLSVVEFPAK